MAIWYLGLVAEILRGHRVRHSEAQTRQSGAQSHKAQSGTCFEAVGIPGSVVEIPGEVQLGADEAQRSSTVTQSRVWHQFGANTVH